MAAPQPADIFGGTQSAIVENTSWSSHLQSFFCSACTSIVTTDQSGRIIQGRNLDFDFANYLRHVTIQVDFQRGGKVYWNMFN